MCTLSRSAHRAAENLFTIASRAKTTGEQADAFRAWMRGISRARVADLPCTAILAATASDTAKRLEAADKRDSDASWRSWLQEGPAKGLRRQHRFSRAATGWVPSAIGHGSYDDSDNPSDDPSATNCKLLTICSVSDAVSSARGPPMRNMLASRWINSSQLKQRHANGAASGRRQ